MFGIVDSVATIDTLATTYNFEVAHTHTYFVGTEGVLVHNSCVVGKNQLLSLTDAIPNPNNRLGANEFWGTSAIRDRADLDPQLERLVNEIKVLGDNGGTRTEAISDRYFVTHYQMTPLDGKLGSNNGLDGIYIEGTTAAPTSIIITESKQWHSGVQLSKGNANTNLPNQMTDAWIRSRAEALINTNDLQKIAVGNMIINALNGNRSIIQKFVVTVDAANNLNPIYFLKLGVY
jgi:hypothetical protein